MWRILLLSHLIWATEKIEDAGPIRPVDNKEVGTLDNVGLAWSLEFDLIVRAETSGNEKFQSLIRVEAEECCGHASRIPALFLHKSDKDIGEWKTRLAVSYPVDLTLTQDPAEDPIK